MDKRERERLRYHRRRQADPEGYARKKSQRDKKRYARLRLETIEAYGGKCACCGEDRPEFLTIDHVNGRKPGDKRTGQKLYRKLKEQGWPKDNLRLLCWNCNCSYGFWGHCPHQEESKVDQVMILGGAEAALGGTSLRSSLSLG